MAYRFFSTESRSFILADTPGHERYTRIMFTGASTADVAVVLVDARGGVVTQTRRHAHISALLGIRHMVVCVNKMDLVSWDAGRFGEVEQQARELTRRLEIADLLVIPISAQRGDNVAFRSTHTPFYDGPTLLAYLESIDVQAPLVADRANLRRAHTEAVLPFVEVYVDTPLGECERRDPKGLYAQARAGEIKGFTGVNAPYEPPEKPEVRIRTAETSVEEAVSEILRRLSLDSLR